MSNRSKPYDITGKTGWPLAAANIDEMFKILFTDVETAQTTADAAGDGKVDDVIDDTNVTGDLQEFFQNGKTLRKLILGWLGLLSVARGGTGIGVYAVGDILYADTTGSLARLADVATGNALISGGVNTAPSWGKISLTAHITGTLAVANGGTGATTAAGARTNLDVQQHDTDLDTISALSGTGIVVRASSASYPLRTITAGAGISVTNGDGVSGNPTIAVTSVGYREPLTNGDTVDPELLFTSFGDVMMVNVP